MAIDINLSSPEEDEKKNISGKPALIFSAFLMVFVLVVLSAVFFLKSKYAADNRAISDEISQEQSKVNGLTFVDIIDFQGRLDSAEKIIDDHDYWDSMAKRMSSYIIPDVKLTKFSGKKDPAGSREVDISGIASNLDALSKELILLKDFPNLDSLEFKDAVTNQGQADQAGGIAFSASLKLNKSAFQK
jgi:hypothetical protein